jgi:hypothetical protein
MNEILLDMSKRVGPMFCSKAQFTAYMAKVYENEQRDAVKTSNTGFKIKANYTDEPRQEMIYERFLSKIEQQAIDQVCPENQLKAKLSATLSLKTAYDLLRRVKSFNLVGNAMKIRLSTPVELTERERGIVLSQSRAVYGDVDDLEFIAEIGNEMVASNSNTPMQAFEVLHLPQGVSGEVSKKLIDKYGVDIYKSWFARLNVSVDNAAKTIELNSSSNMIKDWITSKYGMFLNHVLANIGLKLIG